jgi:GMP synthase (glutamine-hydrolysing)
MKMDLILVLDFGASNAQMVARFVRSENVYSEVLPYDTPIEKIAEIGPTGLILAGGLPHLADALPDSGIYALGIPILAFDRGMDAMIQHFGGSFSEPVLTEKTALTEFSDNPLFEEVGGGDRWFKSASHIGTPPGFNTIATANGVGVAIANMSRNLYALQFYPEQNDPDGLRILYNFSRNICKSKPWWNMEAFIDLAVQDIKEKVGDGKAVLAMSGGVDSAVCAALVNKAIGSQLYCVFVDTGLMRKDEGDEVENAFWAS